jgi:azurin
MRIIVVLGCATLLASTACTEKSEGTPAASSAAPAPAPTPKTETPAPSAAASAAAPAPSAAAQKVEIEIGSVGNLMAFNKTKLSVPTGAEVHVTFKNSGTQDVMQHNWVLVKPGKEASVAADGLAKAPDAGYLVPGPDIIAYTALTKPGGTAETTFTAPAPGNYPYICTFPGHYIMMKGVLAVTP